MDPAELVDACFLRRIQTKIKIDSVSDEMFSEIFRRVAHENGMAFEPNVPKDLISIIRGGLKLELRQCYPRDIVNQVLWAARYENKKPYLNLSAIAHAVDAYFLAKE
jgi:hypothetical protein